MKNIYAASIVLLSIFSSLAALAEDETKIIQKVTGSPGDSSVLIETTKNQKFLRQNFEIVSGNDEIVGEPTAGTKEARVSWRGACQEWKKELKENNKDGQVLIASCGAPVFSKEDTSGIGSGIYTFKSSATYKLKVRIRDN